MDAHLNKIQTLQNHKKMDRECSVEDCEFCEILFSKKNEIIWESDRLFAFKDIDKHSSQEHVLVCSKEHIRNIDFLEKRHLGILYEMKDKAKDIMSVVRYVRSENDLRIGFHKPPLYSIGHLHLHVLALPIEKMVYNRFKYGYGFQLVRIEQVLEKLEKGKFGANRGAGRPRL